MSRLTLRLPQTLHQQLSSLAKTEGVSLNQYIVYALSRQTSMAYTVLPVSEESIQEQKASYAALLQSLGEASPAEIERLMTAREEATPEPELTPDLIQKLRARLTEKQQTDQSN